MKSACKFIGVLGFACVLGGLGGCATQGDVDHAAGRVIGNDNRNAVTLSAQVGSAAAGNVEAIRSRHEQLAADARAIQSSIDDLDAAERSQATNWVRRPLGLAAAAKQAMAGDIEKAVSTAQETILSGVGEKVRDSAAKLDEALKRGLEQQQTQIAAVAADTKSLEARIRSAEGLTPEQIAALVAVLAGGSIGGGAGSRRMGRSRAEPRIDELEERVAVTETSLGRDAAGGKPYIDDLYEQLDSLKGTLAARPAGSPA